MVDPAMMCDQHLLGEHAEIHMLAGTLAKHKSIDGFIARGLLEPSAMEMRHECLVAEMGRRMFTHRSPLPVSDLGYLSAEAREAKVDTEVSARELAHRCERCRVKAAL
ncbi:MAG: pyrimidine dimer DNA glycosylase/endonuclease V [Coriobacteriia bacterium]|nr:pyrimidine dimer DNA glycosylase/endonuclease V [Coriobacteriia bacterium]